MIDEDKRQVLLMEKELEEERLRRQTIENQFSRNNNASINEMNENNSMIDTQLDLSEELDRIYHLLKGDIIEYDNEGGERWVSPDDDRLKILSDYGVKQIMNIIHFYINKNTLLSNYNEEIIFWKVRDFGIELSDLLFNRYEAFFYYPSVEDLYEKYSKIAMEKGLAISEDDLYNKCIQWSKEELQSKLRHYPMIVTALVDSVHSTFLRALNGEERESLRKNWNIHQSFNSNDQGMNSNKFKLLKPSTWVK